MLRLRDLAKSKSKFVGSVYYVDVPMKLRLLKCPRSEEIPSIELPETFTHEETAFDIKHSETLFESDLSKGAHQVALG